MEQEPSEQRRSRRAVGSVIPILRRLFAGTYRQLSIVVVSAFLSGLAQAGVLVIVVGVGVSLTADQGQLSAPLLPDTLLTSTTSAIAIGGALLATAVVLEVVGAIMSARMGSKVLTRERIDAYRRYSSATWSSQAAERDGHLQELMSKNAGWAGTAINSATSGAVGLFSLLALGISAIVASPIAAVALTLVLGLLLAASRPLAGAVRRRAASLSDLNAAFANQIARNVGLARDIRTFDVDEPVAADVVDTVHTISRHWVNIRVMNRLGPLVFRSAGLLVMLGALLVIELGTAQDLAAMGTVVVLGLRGLGYAGAAQRSYQELQNAAPWLDQLWNRVAVLELDTTDRGTAELERIDTLTFADVGFRYRNDELGSSDEVDVLSSLDFSVQRGESVGIVGPSGAGKSTLVKLLLRLHDPESGDLLVNGISARTTRLSDWYQRVGYVPQDVSTFNGTIAENIAFFRADISLEQIETAAKRAHLHREIIALPDGYDTLVGERAGRLSGGQRQRLALARALVGEPDLLVLDEPTSSLDLQSETLVQQTIDELGGSVTLFIIAHRISTLSSCEKIVVLENGKVTALGSPSRVRDSSEFFREATRLARL